MNLFGGDWTEEKIEIVVEYGGVFVNHEMHTLNLNVLYFDGFAGSGNIYKE